MTTQTRIGTVLTAALLLLSVPVAASAASQKVYRCGPEGRTYSQTPCKDGYAVDATDPRSSEQRKAAADSVKREEKLNNQATRDRQAAEAAAAKQGASHIANPAAAKPAASAAATTATATAAAMKKAAAKKDANAKSVKQP